METNTHSHDGARLNIQHDPRQAGPAAAEPLRLRPPLLHHVQEGAQEAPQPGDPHGWRCPTETPTLRGSSVTGEDVPARRHPRPTSREE